GEVVQRPASVVKELVDNSLDAGATAISVEIRGGGLELVRVVDNGSGIPADEAELAFHRFATSKLSLEGNLDSITTLGFRGEALPSIASVSNISLITRPADQLAGTLVEVVAGDIKRTEPQGSPTGTSIAVRDIFRNVPARLKFLKSASAEATRVQTVLHQFALAFPEVRFHLDIDGWASFTSPGGGDPRDACSAVYGTKTARALLEVFSPGDDIDLVGISGLISPPDVSRSTRSYMNFLVNRRWIQSRTLTYALEECYQGFLMKRRHPLAIIHLSVPLQEVDVNVHPAKLEVRFRRERDVFSTLQRAVRGALVALAPVPTVRSNLGLVSPASTIPARSLNELQSQQALSLFAPVEGMENANTPREIVPSLRVLGQIQNLYIVADGPEGVYLVDQHAAHERVLYDKVYGEIRDREPQVQGLLESVVVELPAALEENLVAHRDEWAWYGFDLETFGPHSYLLRALPSSLKDADPEEAFRSILEEVGQGGSNMEWEEKMVCSIACHSAVRAGKILTQEEMESLLTQLAASNQPNTCPHGRPTMIHLNVAHLQREFGRR
ncbi:MAG: DNA mismatch repair endonuclease MutL, partial [Dehalococcoidia bacterium]|nr:DNA mismatch repair endonuclease MutL [Dehalococcoidia bacterium]